MRTGLAGLVPFCPKCKSMIYPDGSGGQKCTKCGWTRATVKAQKLETPAEEKEVVILEGDDIQTQPKMKAECPECGNLEAYWVLRQTRSSDEPETTILTCTKCKARWRRY